MAVIIVGLIITIAIAIPVGYSYINYVKIPAEEGSIMSRCNYSELAAKHEYILENMDKFGCSDHSASINNQEVFAVSPKTMGL